METENSCHTEIKVFFNKFKSNFSLQSKKQKLMPGGGGWDPIFPRINKLLLLLIMFEKKRESKTSTNEGE